jgi:hypothetical protein
MAARGSFFSGNDIQKLCDSGNVACGVYLAGLADAVTFFTVGGGMFPKGETLFGSCIPEGVTIQQLRQVWLNNAKARPEVLQRGASIVGLVAFDDAWRCKP